MKEHDKINQLWTKLLQGLFETKEEETTSEVIENLLEHPSKRFIFFKKDHQQRHTALKIHENVDKNF
ncbi:MAG: hypothetical protein VX737_03365 [Pseudomonadota bacterium]|nr:hypothetical protein [Pseudomonadota bacterium]